MEQKKGSEFILAKLLSGNSILINISNIVRIESYNNASNVFLSSGGKLLMKHSFNSFASRLNVIDMEDDI